MCSTYVTRKKPNLHKETSQGEKINLLALFSIEFQKSNKKKYNLGNKSPEI